MGVSVMMESYHYYKYIHTYIFATKQKKCRNKVPSTSLRVPLSKWIIKNCGLIVWFFSRLEYKKRRRNKGSTIIISVNHQLVSENIAKPTTNDRSC